MPLIEGKSKKTLNENIATEIDAGKDPKQAVAIAYAVKRRNMNLGGTVKHVTQKQTCEHGGPMHCNAGCYAEGGMVTEQHAKTIGHPQDKLARMAEGGEVQNQKLNPGHQVPMDARLRHQTETMRMPGSVQSEVAKLAHGGSVVDEIMHERKRKMMAEGGEVESERDYEPAFAHRLDLANVHYIEDEEHDINENPSDDDYSIVGQIMSEREKKKKDMMS